MVFVFIFVMSACTNKSYNKEKMTHTDNAGATTEKRSYNTFTGRKPLEEVKLKVNYSKLNKGLSSKKIEHSYGVAKDNKPHSISVESQKFLENKKFNAVTYDTMTEKNIYLTFDCGYENGYTSKILDILKEKDVKAAFFCTLDDIKSEPELIARMIKEGHIVGNHSSTHSSFDTLSAEQIASELENCENYLRKNFGYTTKYFRFPKGNYSEKALDVVSSLGFVSVFWSSSYADWDTDNQKGADYAFEKVTQRLHPGAIILLHSVSSDNAGAIGRIIDYARSQSYQFSTIDKIDLSYSNYITQ